MNLPNKNRVEAFCPSAEQWPEVERAILNGFAIVLDDVDVSDRTALRPLSRRVAVSLEQRIFGGAFAYDFQMSLPGGACVPVAGLAGVSVSPPFQGKGGLTAMMREHLQQCRAHGDAASVLMASESGLYGRFGYGVATEMAQWNLNSREFRLARDHIADGDVRLINEAQDAADTVALIYEQSVAMGSGALHRSSAWWKLVLACDKSSWIGAGAQFVAVHYNTSGVADGYALYAIDERSETATGHGRLSCTCNVSELVALNANAEMALLSYLSSIAWVREVVWAVAPVNPVVRHFMADPRQLWQQARLDMMWLRPLNLPALFDQRLYARDGELVIDYHDPLFDDLSGYWKLVVRDGAGMLHKATSAEHRQSPRAVSLSSEVLGAIILGTSRIAELSSIGKITGSADSIRLFDQVMLTDKVPFNLTKF